MKIAYIDCFAGISGDMFVGALLDLGLDLAYLKRELKKLPLKGYSINAVRERRKGISGVRFTVDPVRSNPDVTSGCRRPRLWRGGRTSNGANVKEKQIKRSLKDILELIDRSKLSKSVKDKSSDLFNLLGRAEAKVHGVNINKVHFHEVGAVDSIIDIICAVIGVEKLVLDTIYASPVRLDRHPPPATLELLKDIPMKGTNRDIEMVTPTGAVFLKGFVKKFSVMPEMKLNKIGYGIGSRDDKDLTNVLRILIGKAVPSENNIYIIETNIDDMNPQIYGTLMNELFKEGALDVFWTPVQMKKNRPGILVTVLCNELKLDDMIEILFRETTTFGVRYYMVSRKILDREIEKINGRRIKIGSYNGKVYTKSPEYEDWKGLIEA